MTREHRGAGRAGSTADQGSFRGTDDVAGKRTLVEGLQLHAAPAGAPAAGADQREVASEGTSGPATEFPHRTKIEASFERPIPATAHIGAEAASASKALGAEGYAYGGKVAFRSTSPDLHTAAHEAAHAVQQHSGVLFRGGTNPADNAWERHADAVADRVVSGQSAASLLDTVPGTPVPSAGQIQRKESLDFGGAAADGSPVKDDSARFEGDKELAKVLAGTKTLKKGDTGVQVTKLQQALVDMGYPNTVNGVFDATTETALKKFQKDAPVTETGELDKDTLGALHKKYDTRKPYLDNAKFDPATPNKGVRALSGDDKTAVLGAMVPDRGPAGVFVDDTGDGKKYADEIEAKLTALIASLHKRLFEDKEPLRADPAKNFEKWSVLEAAAKESKNAVDAVYGSYRTGPAMKNPTNFIDQWDDEVARNAVLSPAEKKAKAREKVDYLIVSNCADVNKKHSAVPSGAQEKTKLKPVIDKLVATPADVQKMLELDIGWEGAQLEGQVYLQRYKEATDAGNRERLWKLFHVCIHEYIHALEHDDYHKYAETFRAAGDQARYNTLVEGMCDFYTDNVRATVAITPAMQKNVEGPYHDPAKAAPAVRVGSYPSRAQAEQLVSVVGIRNAEIAFFKGNTKAIGGP